jgi:hypothetical protein
MPPANPPATLSGLVAAHVLDAPLAALTWILVERGIPVQVASSDHRIAEWLLDALVGALPPGRRPSEGTPGSAGRVVRMAGTLGVDTPPGVLRAALAVTTGRSGLAAAVDAVDLADTLAVLASQGLSDDESSFLGVVLVVERRPDAKGEPRVVAAHYLRPLVIDAGGHQRRQRPAVLATWVARGDRWEDFAWGIVADLAERCRLRAGDFEVEVGRRAQLLSDLVTRGDLDLGSLEAAALQVPIEQPIAGE